MTTESLLMWVYSKISPKSFARYQLECKITKLRADIIGLEIKKYTGANVDLREYDNLQLELKNLRDEFSRLEMGI